MNLMKSFNMKTLIYMAVVALFLGACQGDPMNTPPGATGNIVSVAINSDGFWETTPLAVDASTSQVEYNLILVSLSSAGGPAPEDLHVTMVPALDSLASYNSQTFDDHDPDTGVITKAHPEKYYVMPGAPGTPAFTLLDGGVVTIPKGSYFGYLKIKTTSADYFGSIAYAYAYRISAIQEPGYTISANNGYSITPFIPKNPYDGKYTYTGFIGRYDASGVNDPSLGGPVVDGVTIDIVTTGLTTNQFKPYWASGSAASIGGIGVPQITVNPDNSVTLAPIGASPANWGPIAGQPNNYDPSSKTFKINWRWGGGSASPSGYTREMRLVMKYKGSR